MAETRIADVIVPEVFSEYTLVPSIYRSRFYKSGIISMPPSLTAILNGPGKTFNFPAWNSAVGGTGNVPSETVDSPVDNLDAVAQIALRQFRDKIWGANDLSAVLAGSDAIDVAAATVNDFWAQAYDLIGIKSLQGVFADNIANDAGDLVNDISAELGALSNFTDSGVIAAQGLLGENGTLGRGDQPGGDYIAIGVNQDVYTYMRDLDLIDYVPVSGQPRPIPFYMNMQVIVDANFPVAAGVYDTYIFKGDALGFGIGTARYLPTEMDRDTKKGMGIDELITRRAFTMHPYGTAWLDASVAGVTPTDAELLLAANWDRVYPQQTMRAVLFRHKINQA